MPTLIASMGRPVETGKPELNGIENEPPKPPPSPVDGNPEKEFPENPENSGGNPEIPVHRHTTVVFTSTDELDIEASKIDRIHEEHKSKCTLLSLSLCFILSSGEKNWWLISLIQLIFQLLISLRTPIRRPIGRRFLLLFSTALLMSSVISLSQVRLEPNTAPIGEQLWKGFFLANAFIGFLIMNVFNLNLIVQVGQILYPDETPIEKY